ncbi:MAG: hypothetical protein HBSIN02_24750 [Bacteroidia bacterium]|nr:MAG: hypothetical protein HBSIN02_24750 [Bacteroidia bacterium]
MCAPPREKESFVPKGCLSKGTRRIGNSGSAHSFDSGKNNGVLTLNVRRKHFHMKDKL